MPVTKISDAPANIRELDDAKLTLGQVNWILRVYDALKEQGKVESPMAVAIAQFKRSFHKSGGKWVKNEEEAAAMSMVDIEHLDRYVVVPISGQPGPGEVEDLRELEGDFGHGVYPLWSDEQQSIIAFAFEPAFFNEQQAREWVDKAMTPAELSVIDVVQSVFAPVARVLSKALGREEENEEEVHESDPVILHAFAVHLGPGEEAAAGEDDDEDQGLIWKEIIHPGKWFKTDTGRPMEITADIIKAAFTAWKAGLPKYISVPADSHHDQSGGIVPPQANRGFIEKLKLVKDRLFAGFRLTDPEIAQGVQLGNIADVSVFLRPNVTHPETGKQFPWTLQHVLLTNDPLVQDLAPFGVGANSADGEVVVQSYTREDEEVSEMAEETKQAGQPEGLTLTAEEAKTFVQFQGLGLTAAEIQTLVAERESVRQKARDLEITRIVRALEGSEKHESVTQVEDTRHWPVVCAAVEKALREQPQALALAADDDGHTGLDTVVLEIVNALPADGRMALQVQPTGSKDPPDPQADGTQVPTDEQIKGFADRLSPRRGMAVNVPM